MQIPTPAITEFEQLLSRMDQAYHQTAGSVGFECRGCKENCCRTLFYHHTVMELLYLKKGLALLQDDMQARIHRRAVSVHGELSHTGQGTPSTATMCPLNEDGRCVLYAHRPMICRLHGMPHILRRPDGKILSGPGCDDFYRQCGTQTRISLDRTPHYITMSVLERALRQKLDFTAKIRMTIAQMVMVDPEGLNSEP